MPELEVSPKQKPYLSNTAYDFIKKLVQIGLPAFGTLYFTIAQIWGLPHGDEVVGTVAALALFLGLLLGMSSRAYQEEGPPVVGDLNIHEDDGNPVAVQVEFNEPPGELKDSDNVLVKVRKIPVAPQ